ncbi:MAG: GMC family oxidoreductase N-terminal domain-containing protein [Chitinophagales bacterium]|nr:GMC oxidoreductase [Chitinophagales bacterium]MCZ2393360.1 GMC family oxidoreductase N-terminal domain-containing protein [Chitinophagales bacterium]
MSKTKQSQYDFVIIGSGFGGSVSALRLSEKGYKVLVIEKGKWFEPKDFPDTNWQLKKWLWVPTLKFHGLFKITLFRHVGILSGVGVGGGSLVYANTLPIPKKAFYNTGSWANLGQWEEELEPHYQTALKMLGAEVNPSLRRTDRVIEELAKRINKEDQFSPTKVAVYFGKQGVTVPDPYFDGKGPDRTGCIYCGACMLGCKHNAKNTLDKNYLYLAQQLGAEIIAESQVYDIQAKGEDGKNGYEIFYKDSTSYFPKKYSVQTKSVIFSGGVLGTVDLLLKLKEKSLPRLSDMVGYGIRTNSESLIGVTTFDKDKSFSEGVAIGSILHTDENSHLEPVRYSEGAGFWRIGMAPMVTGRKFFTRLFNMVADLFKHPIQNFKMLTVDDWSKRTIILLFMQTLDSTLRLKKSILGISSNIDTGKAPTSDIPEAKALAKEVATIINGKPMMLSTETLLGIPTTAHILGGACMGDSPKTGVIDKDNKVFGYENMYVCDGSMISANPGVNPSLSITAISERAISLIPAK